MRIGRVNCAVLMPYGVVHIYNDFSVDFLAA